MISNKEIRSYFGHSPDECKVIIKRNGEIYRFGSPDDFDRSKDYWQWMGYKEEIIKEIEEIEEIRS